jgi:glucuronosyltransferase
MRSSKLLQEWTKVMSSGADGVVLVSFGSVAPAHAMPIVWKLAILSLAEHFPTYQFIWKYEKDDIKNGRFNLFF